MNIGDHRNFSFGVKFHSLDSAEVGALETKATFQRVRVVLIKIGIYTSVPVAVIYWNICLKYEDILNSYIYVKLMDVNLNFFLEHAQWMPKQWMPKMSLLV